LPTTMGWGIGTVRRPARRLSHEHATPTTTAVPVADGVGAIAVLECPEEATRGICRAIYQVLLHMDG
jgi:hypothetical protein